MIMCAAGTESFVGISEADRTSGDGLHDEQSMKTSISSRLIKYSSKHECPSLSHCIALFEDGNLAIDRSLL